MDRMTIKAWVRMYENGEFDLPADTPSWKREDVAFTVSCKAGWYDWFCKDSALINRTKKFAALLRRITNDTMLNEYKVLFKQTLPIGDKGYHDYIHLYAGDDRGYGIRVDHGCEKHKWAVYRYGTETGNDFECDRVEDLAKWLNAEVA